MELSFDIVRTFEFSRPFYSLVFIIKTGYLWTKNMAASGLKLFADRIGHPSRFCIQFLKLNKIPFEEVKVSLMKGQNKNHSELPLGQIPVLKIDHDFSIAQSTTILRYLGDTFHIEDNFYPKTCPIQKAKMNEFMDFFHYSMNAPLVRAIQNQVFYRLLFNKAQPNLETIEDSMTAFKRSEMIFLEYFLKNQTFIGGENQVNVCDLIASSTFEQARLLKDYSFEPKTLEYLKHCSERIEDYNDVLEDLKSLPELIKSIENKK